MLARNEQEITKDIEALVAKFNEISPDVVAIINDVETVKKILDCKLNENTEKALTSCRVYHYRLSAHSKNIDDRFQSDLRLIRLGARDEFEASEEVITDMKEALAVFTPNPSQSVTSLHIRLQQHLVTFFESRIEECRRITKNTELLSERLAQLKKLEGAIKSVHSINMVSLQKAVREAIVDLETRLQQDDLAAYNVHLQENKVAELKAECEKLEQKKSSLTSDLDQVAQELTEQKKVLQDRADAIDLQLAAHKEQQQKAMTAELDKFKEGMEAEIEKDKLQMEQQKRDMASEMEKARLQMEQQMTVWKDKLGALEQRQDTETKVHGENISNLQAEIARLEKAKEQATTENKQAQQTLTATQVEVKALHTERDELKVQIKQQKLNIDPWRLYGAFVTKFNGTNSTGIDKMREEMYKINVQSIADEDKFTQISKMMNEIASARKDSKWSKSNKIFQGRTKIAQDAYDIMAERDFSLDGKGKGLGDLARLLGLAVGTDNVVVSAKGVALSS